MATSVMIERGLEPVHYDGFQREIIPFTDYSLWERKKSSHRSSSTAKPPGTPTRSRTPSRSISKHSTTSTKDYLLKVHTYEQH